VKSVKCDSGDFDASVVIPASTTAPADPQVVVHFHPHLSLGKGISSKLEVETDDNVQPMKTVKLQVGDADSAAK
jgi:hypothetical protein